MKDKLRIIKGNEELKGRIEEEGKVMFEYEQAGDTPFMLVKELMDDENKKPSFKYFCVIGPHRLTNKFDSKDECLEDIRNITWARVGAVIEATCRSWFEARNPEVEKG